MQIERLNNSVIEGVIALAVCFNMQAEMASGPLALQCPVGLPQQCKECWGDMCAQFHHVTGIS